MDKIETPSVQEDKPAGYTRGPWKIDFGHPRGLPGGISVAKGGRPVTRFNAFARPSTPEALANARLIAAAPELLHELESVRDWLALLAIASAEDVMQGGPAVFDSVSAAISKALPQVSE